MSGRRYKVSASWVTKEARWHLGQAEIGEGFTLWAALRLWVWLLIRHRAIAKITRKKPQRFYFSRSGGI